MGARRIARCAAAALLLCSACAAPGAREGGDGHYRFDGPGRLLLIWHHESPEGEISSAIAIYGAGQTRVLGFGHPVEARWITRDSLLVGVSVEPEEGDFLRRTQLGIVDVATSAMRPIGRPRRYVDPEPSPDGAWLAVGVEADDAGSSDLELWSLDGAPEVAAQLPESADEPRWSPDGIALVLSRTIADPEPEQMSTTASLGGVAFGWPRLFRLERGLGGMRLLHDGPPGGELAPGGSVPLWWDERGIWARQRHGLALCDPRGGGCESVWDPGPERRVMGGRRIADGSALLLVADERLSPDRLPSELHRVDLERGTGRLVYQTPSDLFITDIDWIRD